MTRLVYAAVLIVALLPLACVTQARTLKGYPVDSRRIALPTAVETDLDNSFPKTGSVLEKILAARGQEGTK